MKKLLLAFAVLVLVAIAVLSVSSGAYAQAQTQTQTQTEAPPANNIANNVCRGVLSTESTNPPPPNTTVENCQESGDSSFDFLVKKIINIFSIVVGAVSVIMIIIGGFRYIISGGDSSGVSGAKNTILYAVVGLVIVIFAQVIIRFVLSNVTP